MIVFHCVMALEMAKLVESTIPVPLRAIYGILTPLYADNVTDFQYFADLPHLGIENVVYTTFLTSKLLLAGATQKYCAGKQFSFSIKIALNLTLR